jgi:hypothetical protein
MAFDKAFDSKYFFCLAVICFCLATPKKIASVGAANQVFVVVAKYTGTAPTASGSGKLAARTVAQIKVLVCLIHRISLGVFLYEI